MLTEREAEVAALVAHGLSNKTVAQQLGIAAGTVKAHLHSIYRKLGIENRVQLLLHWPTNNGQALKARQIAANVVDFPKRLGRKN
jgi:DNA-binding NarL/FixJ family response regulator